MELILQNPISLIATDPMMVPMAPFIPIALLISEIFTTFVLTLGFIGFYYTQRYNYFMNLADKVQLLPHSPGVYRYLDASGKVIYVGKAKDLKKRVSQYFQDPSGLNKKTALMVSKIEDLEHTVVDTEEDAFLLENNLIKEYQPKYNILLKDGKTYPWICVNTEFFPRVFITRQFIKDGSLYFVSYISSMHK